MNRHSWVVARLLFCAMVAVTTAKADFQLLPFRPVAWLYSNSLDRLVLITPDQLHIYDPATKSDLQLSIPGSARSLALSVNGNFAAVGHARSVSWIDLVNRAVLRTVELDCDVRFVGVTSQFIYVFPQSTSSSLVRFVRIQTGVVGASNLTYYAPFRPPDYPDYPTTVSTISDGSALAYAGQDTVAIYRSQESGNLVTEMAPFCGWAAMFMGGTHVIGCDKLYLTDSALATSQYLMQLPSYPRAAAYAPQREELAVVYRTTSGSYTPIYDTDVSLYSTKTLAKIGKFTMPSFVSGSVTANSRAEYLSYSSDGSRLVGVVRAAAGNLSNDIAIVSFATAGVCDTAVNSNTVALPAAGGKATVNVTAGSHCLWTANSDAKWLAFSSGRKGGTNTTLEFSAPPNTGTTARSASVTLGTQTLTVTQPPRASADGPDGLPYVVTDAAYSKTLDRLLLVSANPDLLHIYDPVARAETAFVELPGAPAGVAVSADGNFAAVSLDGRVLRVDLKTAAVSNIWFTGEVAARIAMSDRHIYTNPRQQAGARIRIIDIEVGTNTAVGDVRRVSDGKLVVSASGDSLFAIGEEAPQKWRLNAGLPVGGLLPATGAKDGSSCNNGWISADGALVFSACGEVFRSLAATNGDMQLSTSFSTKLKSLVHLPKRGQIVITPNPALPYIPGGTEIQRYTYDTLAYLSKSPLPSMVVQGSAVLPTAEYLFANSDETRLYTVLKGYVGMDAPAFGHAISTIALDSKPAECTFTFSPAALSFPAASWERTVGITTAPGCSWTGTASQPWITVRGSGAGPGSFTVLVAPNTSNASRSGSVTIAGNTLPVTQSSVSACRYHVPPDVAFTSSAATGSAVVPFDIPVEAPVGCYWEWIVTQPARPLVQLTGHGDGYTSIMFDSGTTALLAVGGQTVKVSRLGPKGCKPALSRTSFTASGQTGSATLSFSGECPATWTVSWASSWLQMFPLSGSTAAPQTVQLAVFPNFRQGSRNGLIAFGADIAAIGISESGATGTTEDARFVGRAYHAAFGRNASQAEIDFQIANALNKGVSRADLLIDFLNSTEFNTGGRFVAGLYVGLLARDAEFGGWLYQRNAMMSGQVNGDQLVSNFLNSPEWKLRFGTPSDTEFVRLLYRHILLREATPPEVTFQAGALPSVGRATMARTFLNSDEFRNGTGPRLLGFLLYAALLGRDPTDTELTEAAAQMKSGIPFRSLVQGVVEGVEFPAQIW